VVAVTRPPPKKPNIDRLPRQAITWSVVILHDYRVDRLGTVKAQDQREAYRVAIEKFDVPDEQQNHLFVRRA